MFKNREEAGEKLALKIKEDFSSDELSSAIILGIPRGGIVVGKKVSKLLNTPFDLLIIKKIPAPENKELAIGAIAEGGTVVWEDELVERLKVSNEYKNEIVKEKVLELEKKKEDFRKELPVPDLNGKTVIIVDDGIATGATIKAAIAVICSFKPKEIFVAVPVISPDSLEDIKNKADKVIYLESPEMFFSVGQVYENFEEISDEEVKDILDAKR